MNTGTYFNVECFWCKKQFSQRGDTVNRQSEKYGHSTCKNCFGKEPAFRAARSRIMKTANPFKGKKLSTERREHLSKIKTGLRAWNKGLTKETNESVRKYGQAASKTMKDKGMTGAKNHNWRGGIAPKKTDIPKLMKWMEFRISRIRDDAFRCCKCGGKFLSNELDVHHIGSRRQYPHLELEETNCLTLCKVCHKSFHKKYGRKYFTPGNTIQWMNEDRLPNEMKFSID